jgi:hypothetical protein
MKMSRKSGPKTGKAWRGRRMRQALNLIDNWEEEDVVDPYPTTLGGGGVSLGEIVSNPIIQRSQ